MTDIVIRSSSEQSELAGKLDSVLSSAGFEVWRDDGSEDDFWHSDDVLERIRSAKAAIVIWCERSAASALFRAEAIAARQQGKLIQVSADGEAPPPPFEQAPIAALSGWQGESRDPEFRKILGALKALSAPANDAGATRRIGFKLPALPSWPRLRLGAPRSAAPAPDPLPLPDVPQPQARGRLQLIGIVSAAAVAGWLGGLQYGGQSRASHDEQKADATAVDTGWMARAKAQPPALLRKPSSTAARPAASSPAPKVEAIPRARLASAATPEAASKIVTPPAAGNAEPKAESKTASRTRSERAGEKADKAAAKKSNALARSTKALRPKPARPKIEYANSENMRLFCQNAGSTTRECRRFRRNAPRTDRQVSYHGGP